ERGDCLHYVLRGRVSAEDLLELGAVALQRVDLCDDVSFMVLGAHIATLPGGHCLLLERGTATVPIEQLMVADVPESRAAARQRFIERADCFRQSIGESVLTYVARVARAGLIAAQPLVKEQLSSESCFFRCK